jgi:glucose-6-phosphate isomerase
MNTTSPLKCPAWRKLAAHSRKYFPVPRFKPVQGAGIVLDFSRQHIDAKGLLLLAQLAAERGFDEWRSLFFSGAKINTSEKRAVRHFELRKGGAAPAEVRGVLSRIKVLSSEMRTRKKFKRVINLGIGGSDLGPRLVADAFGDGKVDVRFVANVDAVELERALAGADPASTLCIAVSKTFTTQETLANLEAVRRWGCRNFVAVTANLKEANKIKPLEVLPMWDWVGGRFSVWSAVGLSAACAIGFDGFEEFLSGAREVDEHFRLAPVQKNIPALLALLGVWNVNFLGRNAHAVLPYAHRLRLFPAWLQQVEMESNGKSTDRTGEPVGYATCPVVFGSEGTNAQHSFMQQLHQGGAVPVDFIDCKAGTLLSANARAQAEALTQEGRPSSTLRLPGLEPRALGRLMALYEHKAFVQGVIWNLNSFDQPGVELGKKLANRILKGGR